MADLAKLKVSYLADGSANYTTLEGDVVGLLCARHYGHEWDTTELVLESNQGLAAQGPLLPAGIVINFPKLPEVLASDSKTDTINLFD